MKSTTLGDVDVAGEYKIDGDRVIVRAEAVGLADVVFKRDGAWLRGNGFDLKRQPGK